MILLSSLVSGPSFMYMFKTFHPWFSLHFLLLLWRKHQSFMVFLTIFYELVK